MKISKFKFKISVEKLGKYIPIIYLLSLWFIFAHPYFLKGQVPFPSTYQVNHFPPWSYYEELWGPVKNNAMPDVIDQIYPWRHLTIELWKQGIIPLWNPYNFSGNPHLANYQSAALSPFNILFFILPFIDAWSILVLLQPLLAGIFTYLLIREFRVGKTGSIIGSICFMFSGFIVVWMAYGTLSLAISLLPLALFAVEKFYKTKKIRYLLLLSLIFPLSFFSGHFQTSLYFLLFVFAFIAFKFFQIKNLHKTFYLILYTIFGLLLCLPQILPTIELYLNSVRRDIFIGGGGIQWWYLVTSFAPDFFGNPVTRNDWLGYYAENASFIGVVPLTLGIISLLRRNSYALFFFLMGILALVLAVNSSFQNLLGSLQIPVFSTSAPNRIIVLFSFSFSVLAGFGLDNLERLITLKKGKRILSVFGGFGVLILAIWGAIFMSDIFPQGKSEIALRNFVLPTALFLGACLLVGVNYFVRNKKVMFVTISCFLLASSFDSFRFAQKWMPFDPKDFVFKDLPVINAMSENINYGRYYGNLGAQVASYYELSSIEGYDPLYPRRYGEFVSSIGGEYKAAERSVAKIPRVNKFTDRVLDTLGVNLIFHPIIDTRQSWAYAPWKDVTRFNKVYKDDKFELFRNNQALPHAHIFYDYEVVKDEKGVIKRFYDEKFDFRNKLIIEENVDFEVNKGEGSVEIKRYSVNDIEIFVKTNQNGLLFLSDNYYPGWNASIDNKPTKIYSANYAFRAVEVPKGKHKIEFKYDPLSFKAGLFFAVLGLIGIIFCSVPYKKLKIKY